MISYFKLGQRFYMSNIIGNKFHILTPRYDRDSECALGRYNLFELMI